MTNLTDTARARRLIALNNLRSVRRGRPDPCEHKLAQVFRSRFGLAFG